MSLLRPRWETNGVSITVNDGFDTLPSVKGAFHWGGLSNMLHADFGGETWDFTFSVGMLWLSFWLSIRVFPWCLRRWSYAKATKRAAKLTTQERKFYPYQLDPFDGRTTGITYCEGYLRLDIWRSDELNGVDQPGFRTKSWWSWSWGRWPWNGAGWHFSINLLDLLLGKSDYTEDEHYVFRTAVDLPERSYPATVEIVGVTWPRQGWLGRLLGIGYRHHWRASVNVPGGVPIPGKGENSWDCEEDARCSVTFAADPGPLSKMLDINRHVTAFVDGILETRRERGGPSWIPEKLRRDV